MAVAPPRPLQQMKCVVRVTCTMQPHQRSRVLVPLARSKTPRTIGPLAVSLGVTVSVVGRRVQLNVMIGRTRSPPLKLAPDLPARLPTVQPLLAWLVMAIALAQTRERVAIRMQMVSPMSSAVRWGPLALQVQRIVSRVRPTHVLFQSAASCVPTIQCGASHRKEPSTAALILLQILRLAAVRAKNRGRSDQMQMATS